MGFTDKDNPVIDLAKRLKYYPLCQVISRAGASYYQLKYGSQIDATTTSPFKITTMTVFAVFTPITGFLYFLVFLKMQPRAYQHLHAILLRIYQCKYFSKEMNSNEESKSSTDVTNNHQDNPMMNSMEVEFSSKTVNEENISFDDCNYDDLDEAELVRRIAIIGKNRGLG
jgi:hypothetical protein